MGGADASRAACREFPQPRTLVPWPCGAMPRRNPALGLRMRWRCAAWLSGVHPLWSYRTRRITAPPPEPPRWTRLECVLPLLPCVGGIGPAHAHGALNPRVIVERGLPHGSGWHDDMSGRRCGQREGCKESRWH